MLRVFNVLFSICFLVCLFFQSVEAEKDPEAVKKNVYDLVDERIASIRLGQTEDEVKGMLRQPLTFEYQHEEYSYLFFNEAFHLRFHQGLLQAIWMNTDKNEVVGFEPIDQKLDLEKLSNSAYTMIKTNEYIRKQSPYVGVETITNHEEPEKVKIYYVGSVTYANYLSNLSYQQAVQAYYKWQQKKDKGCAIQ